MASLLAFHGKSASLAVATSLPLLFACSAKVDVSSKLGKAEDGPVAAAIEPVSPTPNSVADGPTPNSAEGPPEVVDVPQEKPGPVEFLGTSSGDATELAWSPVAGADAYRIYSGALTADFVDVPASTTTFRALDLEPWKTYSFRVAAVIKGVAGLPSSPVLVRAPITFFAQLADESSGIFCPRTRLSLGSLPPAATQFCLKENSATASACVWEDLPLPAAVRAATIDAAVRWTLWFRDGEGTVALGGDGVTSNDIHPGPTQLPSQATDWGALLTSPGLTSPQIDELNCRADELSSGQALSFANLTLAKLSTAQRAALSRQLAGIIRNDLGVAATMPKPSAQKALWRLMVRSVEAVTGLVPLDLAAVDLAGHNISGLDFTGTNLTGSALNGIDPLSTPLLLSGLNLQGWIPAVNQNFTSMNLSGAQNIPWTAINAGTGALTGANFSGLDLTDFHPGPTRSIVSIILRNATHIPWTEINAISLNFISPTGMDLTGWTPNTFPVFRGDYTGATNIPWAAVNACTNVNCYWLSSFSGLDVSAWNPNPARRITNINFTNATNLPWAALNAITHATGYSGINFSGVNLSGWNPATTKIVSGIKFLGATNIPWAALNANANSSGISSADFTGMDLTGWNPLATQNIAGIKISGATNIPWAALSANTNAAGYQGADFRGLDLASWVPVGPQNSSTFYAVNFAGARNLPWAALNSYTGTYGQVDFSGIDLTGWSPSPSASIGYMNLVGTTNVPWAALNALTSCCSGWRLTGLDLSLWTPSTTRQLDYIIYKGSTNIPWSLINTNTNSFGLSFSDFTGLDLSAWSPRNDQSIVGIVYTDATNIPWAAINANTTANGYYKSNFSRVDLKNWTPQPAQEVSEINYSFATNLPWQYLNAMSTVAGFTQCNFTGVDLTGFNPTGKTLQGAIFSPGVRNPADFVEATGITPGPGTKWIDGTYPWGP